eukprot:8849154-Karenia_brevis.AAC.1
MGSDHRAVLVKLTFGSKAKQRWKRGNTFKSMTRVGWRPIDGDKYKRDLDAKLEGLRLSIGLETNAANIDKQVEKLESAVRETVALCEQVESSVTRSKFVLDSATAALINQRRALCSGGADAESRRELSKKIQKNIRKLLRQTKQVQIQERLSEFKDLKSISGIRANGKKHLLQ